MKPEQKRESEREREKERGRKKQRGGNRKGEGVSSCLLGRVLGEEDSKLSVQ